MPSITGKEFACDAGDVGLIPGSGRSPGEGNGNPLQYSCLGNPMDRGAWWATVHGVTRVRHDLETTPPPPQLMALLKKLQYKSAVFHNGPYSEKWVRVFSRQLCKKPITCLHRYCSHPSSIKLASPNWISLLKEIVLSYSHPTVSKSSAIKWLCSHVFLQP